MNALNVD
jgi:hypothetical protein